MENIKIINYIIYLLQDHEQLPTFFLYKFFDIQVLLSNLLQEHIDTKI